MQIVLRRDLQAGGVSLGRLQRALIRGCFAILALAFPVLSRAQSEDKKVTPPGLYPSAWLSEPPADCPLENSQSFAALQFTGRSAAYTHADTWYPSWGADDRLYSPWTDGSVESQGSLLGSTSGYKFSRTKKFTPSVGFAMLEGDNPLEIKIVGKGLLPVEPFPYGGQYPCGSLVHNGVWYYGSYTLDEQKGDWDVMGPFVGFRISTDLGKSWLPESRTAKNPLFGESAKDGNPVKMWGRQDEYDAWPGKAGKPGAKVKIGSPHFVDFGKNMLHSPDGKAYLVAHGATRPEAANSWIGGDQIYLLRVTPGIETINDPKAYEFFAGHDSSGKPSWSSDFARIKPLLEWNARLGCVTITWNPPLKKYLMFVCDGGGPKANPGGARNPYNTLVLEADAVAGPYRMVSFMKEFGDQAYFVNVPSKFIGADGKSFWLCYSNGWSYCKKNNPIGSGYSMSLQEVRLLTPAEAKQSAAREKVQSTWKIPENLAGQATATASSCAYGSEPKGAVDGKVLGLAERMPPAEEWIPKGDGIGSWLRLTWKEPQSINRVWLFAGSCYHVQLQECELHFSDGSMRKVVQVPMAGRQGLQIDFPTKSVTWMEVRITKRSNAKFKLPTGLSEVAVFKVDRDRKEADAR